MVKVRAYTRKAPCVRKSRKSKKTGRVGRGMKEKLIAQIKKRGKEWARQGVEKLEKRGQKLAKKGIKKLGKMALERIERV